MIRFLDFIFSFLGIVILMPFFILVSILIKLNSKGSLIYKQSRVGLNNVDFFVFKFRTMKMNSDKSGLLTVGGRDPRITSIGFYLRKYKLDELPQLFNVLIGDMSLVGPRPEVRKYVDLYTKEQLKVLNVKPGITDYASIEYANENEILGKANDPNKVYIQEIMPAKIQLNMRYIQNISLKEYFKIILLTIKKIMKK